MYFYVSGYLLLGIVRENKDESGRYEGIFFMKHERDPEINEELL